MRPFFEPGYLLIGLQVGEWKSAVASLDGTPGTEYRTRKRTFCLCFFPMIGVRWDQWEDPRDATEEQGR